MAKAVMLQGTASHVGKSALGTALCRIFRQDGWDVAPFKSQNMSNNSFVTLDGAEIGRAQGIQALAAGIEPTAAMNPILLKPKGGTTSQVVVMGRALGDMTWARYRDDFRPQALGVIRQALQELQAAYDLIVIEGAGSPAEVNLMDRDMANMRVAELAQAPVILVADIERGGVFAQVVGTLSLLPPHERARVNGVIINKFRGDPALFSDGVTWLEQQTGVPVLGVLPTLPEIGIDEEDSLGAISRGAAAGEAEVEIAVIRLPHISNFTDFDAFSREACLSVRYVERAADLGRPDAVILPGTKNTVLDLLWLYESGLAAAACRLAGGGVPVVGICGGYQMLGEALLDPDGVEGPRPILQGLGLLPVETTFVADKVVRRAEGETPEGLPVAGYEIHMGRTAYRGEAVPALILNGHADGARAGEVWGTYLHGVFDADRFRRRWLNGLRRRRGLLPLSEDGLPKDPRAAAFDRWAKHVRQHLNMEALYALVASSGSLSP